MGCVVDSDCMSGVCDATVGTCVDEGAVLYAAPAGAGTSCTQSNPCAIATAVSLVDVTRDTLKLASGTYNANIVIADKRVVVHGANATLTSTSGSTLTAKNRARLRVLDLTIVASGASAKSFECLNGVDAPFVELDNVTLDAMSNPIASGGPCTLTITRSRLNVRSSASLILAGSGADVSIDRSLLGGAGGGGILSSAAIIRIKNSVISDQSATGGFSGIAGVGGGVLISYSTIVNSNMTCGNGSAASCNGTLNGVCLDNSIVFATTGTNVISSPSCSANHTLLSPQSIQVGSTNLLGVDPAFVSQGTGDFHLQAGSPALDKGDPTVVNPIDFDGTSRPQGAAADLGAFERVP
ncbi:MAG TPA: choice-of-anchor Q domain-containing protein [Kofleriaceae bacterium]|nr:choice-of-anchor Q domain-containing protein [Kofleriaceae bacterium]